MANGSRKSIGADHDALVKLMTQFGGHTEECSIRYAEAKHTMNGVRMALEGGMAELKTMVSGFSEGARNNADQINIRVNALSTRVLLAVLAGAGTVITGLLMILGTVLMYGRPWDHL
jgi:hypothetical protein